MTTTYPEMAAWLARTPTVDEVFTTIVEALDTDESDPEFHVVRAGGGAFVLAGSGRAAVSATAIEDLCQRGLVRVGRYSTKGAPIYQLPADALHFDRWRRQQPTPVQRVATPARSLVDDAGFADRHPDADTHLRLAFDALDSTERLDLPTTTTVGDHLRKALIDVVGAAAGLPVPDERLAEVVKPIRRAAAERADTATVRLLDLTRAVIDLDHGVHHARDEDRHGRPPADAETVRRAAFLTAVCCHELDRHPLARHDPEQ